MTDRDPFRAGITRRRVLQGLGAGLVAGPVASIFGCDEPASATEPPRAAEWATGGTAGMLAKDSYPDPFEEPAGCPLVCETTAGPCTADSKERVDVSEGMPGLPVRLLLRVVDDSCAPISGAVVQIWHTQRSGIYSGATPSGMCHGGNPSAASKLYFRGYQTTDERGRVAFDSCFPGWYPGRAVHIHFGISVGGARYVVSQLFFDEDLVTGIFSQHPEYETFGQPDTRASTDNIIGDVADRAPYTLETQRMSDGAMLAWKTIAVRASGPGCAT